MKLTSFLLDLDIFCWSCSATDCWCTLIYSAYECIWSRRDLDHKLCNDQILDIWNTTFLNSLSVYVWLDLSLLQSLLACVPCRHRKDTFDLWHFVDVFLKFLSFGIGGLSFPASVTGFFLTHCLSTSTGFGKSHCCQSSSSLTKSDQIWGNLYSMFLVHPLLILCFPIVSSDYSCVSSFS